MDIFVRRRVCDYPTSLSSIFIGINRTSDVSIPIFLCGSVRSSHIWNPNFQHLFGFISDFSILFTNDKPCTKSSIATSPESSVNTVTHVFIGTFICSIYSVRNVDTVQSSKVNDIVQKMSQKQWVSAWLSISVAYAIQITLSLLLCTSLIIQWFPVLMLNTFLSISSSVTRSASQVFVRSPSGYD